MDLDLSRPDAGSPRPTQDEAVQSAIRALPGDGQMTSGRSETAAPAAECYRRDPRFVRIVPATGAADLKQDLDFLMNMMRSGSNVGDTCDAADARAHTATLRKAAPSRHSLQRLVDRGSLGFGGSRA